MQTQKNEQRTMNIVRNEGGEIYYETTLFVLLRSPHTIISKLMSFNEAKFTNKFSSYIYFFPSSYLFFSSFHGTKLIASILISE